MNGYIAFWNGKRVEVYADTLLAAKEKAAEEFQKTTRRKVKYADVNVALAEIDGKPYTHVAVD